MTNAAERSGQALAACCTSPLLQAAKTGRSCNLQICLQLGSAITSLKEQNDRKIVVVARKGGFRLLAEEVGQTSPNQNHHSEREAEVSRGRKDVQRLP